MTNKITLFLLITLILTPTSLGVFAQTETENLATTSTTTVEINDDWYESEMLSGNVEVGDFVVGPGRTEISLAPGETIIQNISVTNRISDNRLFELVVEDITGSADGSSAVRSTGDERGPYSIIDYISFQSDTFTLALGERAQIPIMVSVPEDAEPGGYYGSVLISTVQKGEQGETSAPRSPLIARVGSLFFLTIEGDVETEGEVLSLDTLADNKWFQSGPIDLGVVYENSGSIHLNPYGEISITNMFGEEVGYVQLEPWFVLPKSLRIREVTWDREFLLGRYSATAKINRGYDNLVDEVSVTFWVLPWKVVGTIFVGVFIVLFSLRAFFRRFEFKRKGI